LVAIITGLRCQVSNNPPRYYLAPGSLGQFPLQIRHESLGAKKKVVLTRPFEGQRGFLTGLLAPPVI
jgi:hypothetical protein